MSDFPHTLFLARGSAGIAWYRCVLPASALGADWAGALGRPPELRFVSGVAEREMSLAALGEYEVVVLQQPVGEGWFKEIRELQRRGVTVLYEIDDYMHAVRKIDSHELKDNFDREWVASAELNMRIADGVICSTEFLARRYRKFNERIWVCPNGIDLKRYAYARREREHVTIGWAGGVGHVASVTPWLPAVAAVLRARPEARFTTVGSNFAGELVEEFGAERCRALPFAPIEVYPASVSTFDVALAPSGNNNLFRGKSDLRWLEASALRIPVVGDPSVYPEIEDRVTGMAATNVAEAEAALLALVDDAALRTRLGDAAHAHVLEHRRIEVAAQRWAEVLREAVATQSTSAA
jgi:glycosyltransferase involved in cell wall biosynthesis